MLAAAKQLSTYESTKARLAEIRQIEAKLRADAQKEAEAKNTVSGTNSIPHKRAQWPLVFIIGKASKGS
jgi:hypothetical protein